MWKGFGVRPLWRDRVRHVSSEMPRNKRTQQESLISSSHCWPQGCSNSHKESQESSCFVLSSLALSSFLSSRTMPMQQPIDFHYAVGPDVFLLSTWGQGAIRQQPWREIQDKTAPLPAATAWQRGECNCSCSQPLLATLESLDCRRTVTQVMVL